jgi:YggT family protein
MIFVIQLVHFAARLFILVVLADILLSYFMQPYHPVRQALDSVVQPLLRPIQRVVPPVGMIDFSPLVLLILIQVAESLITWVLASLM